VPVLCKELDHTFHFLKLFSLQEFYGHNFTLDVRIVPLAVLVPNGDYRLFINFYPVRDKPPTCIVTMAVTIVSPVKDSFG
jgi:hypothetical protein